MSSNAVKDAISEMYDLMSQLGEFGASDTEPRAEFAIVLQQQLAGRELKIPTTAAEWQLYDAMPGSADAAQRLTAKTREVVKLADANHRLFVQAMAWYF